MNTEQLLEKAMSLSKEQLIKIIVDLLKEQKEFSSHYIAKEIKPTTDIEEVRKKVLDNIPTGSYTELSN